MRLALVGCGPKGLFALERLIAHTSATGDAQIVVDVFEPHPSPGAGPVYDPDQPDYLRMNFGAGQIDAWWRGSGPAAPCPRADFTSWRGSPGDAYPPRAEVGRYLVDGLSLLLKACPRRLRINFHDRRVGSVERVGQQWSLSAGQSVNELYDEVMLTTGHEPLRPGSMMAATEEVPAGASVGFRGFALTFIDAALSLTEGRGGRFLTDERKPEGLEYRASRTSINQILPFSRSGRPMLAKPDPGFVASILGLEEAGIVGRRKLAAIELPIFDLAAQVLPVVTEAAIQSMNAANQVVDPQGKGSIEGGEMLAYLQRAVRGHHPRSTDPGGEIRRSLLAGMGSGPVDAQWAMGQAWRTLYPALSARLSAEGLESDQWPGFRRLATGMERLAFGPPPVNAAKLLALEAAGVVDLDNVATGRPGTDVIVDAVIPPPGITESSAVFGGLLRAGHVRIAPGRRGVTITPSCDCVSGQGEISRGLAAYGRPTEDWVVGNDTLSRSLHPQVDAWASRIARSEAAGD